MNYNIEPIEPGDFISHVNIPKTLGIAYEKHLIENYIFWDVHWIMHPDIDMFGSQAVMNSKYIRRFKPWRGFYDECLTTPATDATLAK
mgnify:CR=1 FL=1